MATTTQQPGLWERIIERISAQRTRAKSALAMELGFHRDWLLGAGGVTEHEWRLQNQALFVALSNDPAQQDALVAVGIDAFIADCVSQTCRAAEIEAAFESIWGRPFAGKNVLDVGCGSRLRTSVFASSRIACIDPLIAEYRALSADPYGGANVVAAHSLPAETFVPSLRNSQELAFCWNVLDHCTSWHRVLRNIVAYLRPGGLLILGTDCSVHDGIHAPINGGGAAITRALDRAGVRLAYELPARALSRDWAGVFRKAAS